MKGQLQTRFRALNADHLRIEQELRRHLPPRGSNWVPVHMAMEHAVLGRGKRIRPLLALQVARIFIAERPQTIKLAIAIELVHCASLVIDDLPCMDNELRRRGSPSTHMASGEALAILAAFALVTQSIRMLIEMPQNKALHARVAQFRKNFLRAIDYGGLIAGQAQDLRFGPMPTASAKYMAQMVADLKTVPLFRLSVSAGSLFANITSVVSRKLDEFASEFGRLYQRLDDMADGDCPDDDWGLANVNGCIDKIESLRLDVSGLREILQEVVESRLKLRR